jgi:hypothetical protein
VNKYKPDSQMRAVPPKLICSSEVVPPSQNGGAHFENLAEIQTRTHRLSCDSGPFKADDESRGPDLSPMRVGPDLWRSRRDRERSH